MDTSASCGTPGCQSRATIGSHCKFHAKKFLPLYNKYKKMQQPVDKYLDNPELITNELSNVELLRLVNISNKVAQARNNYRTVAYRPEYHDHGHENIIQKLLKFNKSLIRLLTERFSIEIDTLETELAGAELNNTETISVVDSLPDKVINSNLNQCTRALVKNQHNLELELEGAMKVKQTYTDGIKLTLQLVLNQVNDAIGKVDNIHAPLTLDSREAKLLFCSPKGFTELINTSMGIVVRGNTLIAGKPHPVSAVINWDVLPAFDLAVELLYQGISKVDTAEYEDNWDIIALAIIELRKHPGNCILTFDYSTDTAEISVTARPHNVNRTRQVSQFEKTFRYWSKCI